jgi:RNA polymerase sigma-70 factor (ECF subfamily)
VVDAARATPELERLKVHYRDAFQDALDRALVSLAPRQRALLRMHHVDGYTLDRLATIHQVHRATVARWLSDAREQIVRETHRLLGERFALTPSEIASLAAIVESQLAISLTQLA